jgi:hypothetical protein
MNKQTFEEFISKNYANGIANFSIRTSVSDAGVEVYICTPEAGEEVLDFKVRNNVLLHKVKKAACRCCEHCVNGICCIIRCDKE